MGRDRKKGDSGRDPGGFAAMPWTVLDSPAYTRLSHPGKALLMELARQFVRDNNGKLLCSRAYLRERGWKSADVVQRAKVELLEAGFIFETCKGQRPNKASWYAVTWRTLDRHQGYDHGALESFERGAYRKNAAPSPSPGTEGAAIVPSPGTEKAPPVPSPGTIRATFGGLSVPSPGHHLEKPSTGRKADRGAGMRGAPPTRDQAGLVAHETLAQPRAAIGGNSAKLWRKTERGHVAGLVAVPVSAIGRDPAPDVHSNTVKTDWDSSMSDEGPKAMGRHGVGLKCAPTRRRATVDDLRSIAAAAVRKHEPAPPQPPRDMNAVVRIRDEPPPPWD